MILSRVGAGDPILKDLLLNHGVGGLVLGAKSNFDCVKAAVLDAIYLVCGEDAASKLMKTKGGGASWNYSIGSVTHLIEEAKVPARVRKPAKKGAEAIRNSNRMVGMKWFGEMQKRGVFILLFGGHDIQPHAITIDTKRRRIYDKAQPCILRLSTESLVCVADSGETQASIISAREIRVVRRSKEN